MFEPDAAKISAFGNVRGFQGCGLGFTLWACARREKVTLTNPGPLIRSLCAWIPPYRWNQLTDLTKAFAINLSHLWVQNNFTVGMCIWVF